MLLGIKLTLLIGENEPRPAPSLLMEALNSVEVTHSDEGRSGFQLIFQLGRSRRSDLQDYQLIKSPRLKLFNRVILIVTLGANARVLMDGVITNHQLAPSPKPGASTFTITGEDVSLMMDLEEKSLEHKQQDEAAIARAIIKDYATYGLKPQVSEPKLKDRPTQNERIPSQQGTDLEYLKDLADRFAFVFFVTPDVEKAGENIAYWGPPPPSRKTEAQKALSLNMLSFTNVDSINLQNNGISAAKVTGSVQDRKTNQIKPVRSDKRERDRPALANKPTSPRRTRQYRETARDTARADAHALATTNRTADDTITVSGEFDTTYYGDLLQLRRLVGLRGVGYDYDGLYYVKSVTHKISQGEYKQSFTLKREGPGTTVRNLAP